MADIIAATTIAGGWFLGKVLEPSAKALGDNLRAYLGHRVSKIFSLSEEISKKSSIDPKPIAPGLVSRMIIDASFSSDEEDITKWWANLFVDASIQGSNQHAVFSDMMAILGPSEIRCLDDFVRFCLQIKSMGLVAHTPQNMSDTDTSFEFAIESKTQVQNAADHYDEIVFSLLSGTYGWPIRPTEWRLPRRQGEETIFSFGFDQWSRDHALSLNILERAGIIRPLRATFSVWGGAVWVRANSLTQLGYAFYRACKGTGISDSP